MCPKELFLKAISITALPIAAVQQRFFIKALIIRFTLDHVSGKLCHHVTTFSHLKCRNKSLLMICGVLTRRLARCSQLTSRTK